MGKTIENNIESQNGTVQITALSGTALLVNFGHIIDLPTSDKVMGSYHQLQQANLPWIIELIPAYCSIGIVYNLPLIKCNYKPNGLVFDWVRNELMIVFVQIKTIEKTNKIIIEIPICFDAILPNDLQVIANKTSLPIDDITDIFINKVYHVFMLGFLPGFTYMGSVDNRIAMPRKNIAIPLNAGAVGIAGMQAGIYPLASPGGWHILGHTPFNMFDVKNNPPNLLKAGDEIKFKIITKEMYFNIKNERWF